MKFVNLNEHRKEGNWVNTWKAWNKQYLQPLNAKITSLQDYVVYNCPEYVIFNSPYSENPIDITEGLNSLQKDVNYEDVNGNSSTISLFFPARLSWHQGFYNQSEYGDGVLMYKKDDTMYQSYNYINMPTIQHYIFKEKGDIATPIDPDFTNYRLYVLLSSIKESTYSGQIAPSEFNDSGTGVYVGKRSIFIGASAEDVEIWGFEGGGDGWEYGYNGGTGFLVISKTQAQQRPAGPVSFSFKYKIDIKSNDWKKIEDDTLIHPKTFECLEYLFSPLYLIHESNIDYYEATGFLQYNAENNTFQIKETIPKKLVYLDNNTNNPIINQTSDTALTTTSLPSNFNQFANFPSGYICILNKQPIGINNEMNSIKQSLDSYLIAPIGNGAYYTLNFFGDSLIAEYTTNDLKNFTNQVRINLGQNLRYMIKNPVYLMGINSSDNKGGTFALSNIGIHDNEIIDIITDHAGNLWTGGKEIVAQTIYNTTKEEVFIDVMYNTYTSQLKRNVAHNFNISTTEDIADIETSNQEKISMIQLQLF